MPKHIPKEIKDLITKDYLSQPQTLSELSLKYKLSSPTIAKILNERDIGRYNKVQLFSPKLKEDFFENIDTEEKAYFLGLIITDGCVHKTRNKQASVSITLHDNDTYLLERFKAAVNSNKKITNDGRGCSSIMILSDKMADDLAKYGVVPNKSFATIFPKDIANLDLYGHLLRGIFDGDGSMSFYRRQNRTSHDRKIRLCQGNRQFLIDIIDFLYDNFGIKKTSIREEKDNLWSFSYRKNSSLLSLIDLLYKNASIYMKRKKEICEKIKCEIIEYGNTEITFNSNELKVS